MCQGSQCNSEMNGMMANGMMDNGASPMPVPGIDTPEHVAHHENTVANEE